MEVRNESDLMRRLFASFLPQYYNINFHPTGFNIFTMQNNKLFINCWGHIEFVSKTQNIRITGGETPTSAGQVSDVGNAVPLSVVDGKVREELVPGILHDVPREQLGAGIFLQRHEEIVE